MNPLNSTFCCGCLESERKMELISNHWNKLEFFQLFAANTLSYPEAPLWLCWECKELFNKFTRFRKQVASCYNILLNHSEQKKLKHPTHSRLNAHKLFSTSYTPENLDSELKKSRFEIIAIKNENFDLGKIKHDPEDFDPVDENTLDNNFSDEDEKLLITMTTKKKPKKSDKAVNGHRKKKKKKGTEVHKEEVLDRDSTEEERRLMAFAEDEHRKKIKKETEIHKEVVLEREGIEEERRMMALAEDYVNAMFKCERCITSYPNAEDLKDHVDIKHNQDLALKCDICECTFSTEVSYNYHTNKHKKRYECNSCMERFTSKRAVMKHYENVHCIGPTQDYTAEKITTTDNPKTDADRPSYKCGSCEKVFKWKTSLRKHTETHSIETGQKRKPYCEPCRLSFTTTSNLQKHVKTSSKHQIQLKLMKLKETLPEDSTLENQEAKIELIVQCVNGNKQRYKCVQCDKRFQWRGNLLRHMHSHRARANGELVCKPCDRTFSSIATYQQHMKISRKHVSENDFKYMCSECGKRFANKTRLKDHVDWDHLKHYAHTCPQCQKVFKSHTSLYLHKQVVHRKKGTGHLCDHCGKSFPNHAKLRSHITALHTDQSPYCCSFCSARFSWHSCLSRHVRRVHRVKREGDIPVIPTVP